MSQTSIRKNTGSSLLVLLVMVPVMYFEYWFVVHALSSIMGAQTALHAVTDLAKFFAILMILSQILAGSVFVETVLGDPVFLKRDRTMPRKSLHSLSLVGIGIIVVTSMIPTYILYVGGVPAFTQSESVSEAVYSLSDTESIYRFETASFTMLLGIFVLSLGVSSTAYPFRAVVLSIIGILRNRP